MFNKLIHRLALAIISYCEGRGKVFFITGKNAEGGTDTYLIRYLLVNSKYFNFYVHRFLRSDHDVPHDHPWDFMTYVVDGSYREAQYIDRSGYYLTTGTDFERDYNFRAKGSLAFRKATDVHKVLLERTYTVEEKEQAPLTICITGRRKRTWGFWKGHVVLDGMNGAEQNDSVFTRWTDYLGIPDDSDKRG